VQVAREFSGKVTFFGVAWKATEAECRRYVRDFEVPYDNGLDAGERIFELYGVPYQPATVLISRDGRLVDQIAGGVDHEFLAEQVGKLVEA
jgi:hypothetical protein